MNNGSASIMLPIVTVFFSSPALKIRIEIPRIRFIQSGSVKSQQGGGLTHSLIIILTMVNSFEDHALFIGIVSNFFKKFKHTGRN